VSLKLIILAAFFVPLAAFAHDSRVTRAVAIEAAGDHLEVLVSLRIPAGPQREMILAGIDVRHDGLDASETRALEKALATRALNGLALMVGTATVTLQGADLKMRFLPSAKEPIDLVILGRAPLSSASLSLAVKVGDGVDLSVLAGTRAVVKVSRGTIARGGVKTVLGAPDRVSWELHAH